MWEAWVTLARSRQASANGPQPISITDAVVYLQSVGYSRSAQRDILWLVQAIDAEYLQLMEKERNARSRTSNQRGARKARRR